MKKKFDELTKEQKWDIVFELVHDIDIGNCNGNIYVNIYQDTDDENILTFDDWESEKKFNAMIIEELKSGATNDYLGFEVDITEELENFRAQRGDEDYFVELITEDSWTYYDEGFVCDECQKWHYYEERNGVGYANYMNGDGWIICEDCLKASDEYKELYLRDLIDNPKNASTILQDKELKELGFELVNHDRIYENGMYGDNDKPTEIFDKFKNEYPNMEFVFMIRKIYNPFTTQFDLYAREMK